MKRIPIGHDKFVKVDDEDYEWLIQWSWYFTPAGYAARGTKTNGKSRTITMHRQIMGFPACDVDHVDRVKLNCQRYNLRVCSEAQNTFNIGKRKTNTSGYIGVDFNQGKWRAKIRVDHKRIHIGYFPTKEEAARAYNETALKLRGEFAVINALPSG